MKTAFTLFLIALMIIPAVATVRIMVSREKRRLRDEAAERADKPRPGGD